MTSREESDALLNIEELMASDLTKQPPERLAEGVRRGELVYDQVQRWVGLLVLELRNRGMSWAEVVALTEVDQNTVRRRADVARRDAAGDG